METRLVDRLVVTRLDISKLGWTPYVYYTTLHSTPPYTIFRQIYWAGELLEKRVNLGEIRVRDKMSFCKKRGFRKQEDWVQRPLSQRFGHPRVLGIPIPISLAFWASPVGDAQNADHFDFA